MGHIAGRAVAVDHPQRRVAEVRELVEDARWNIDQLPRGHGLPLFPETHLAGAFDDEIDLLLFLVVPRHLAAFGIERDIAHRKARRLHGRDSADEILRPATRGVAPAFDFA